MSTESFREHARAILTRMLNEAPQAERGQLVEVYTEVLTRLYAAESHKLLNQVLDDTRMRLDARLSPDPISQGIANIQTTMQDLWDSFWKG